MTPYEELVAEYTATVIEVTDMLARFGRRIALHNPNVSTTLAVNAGDAQTGTVAAALSTALSVVVRVGGTVASGVTVLWVDNGDGSIAASSVSDGSGIASATWTLGTGAGAQSVTASVAGAVSLTFSATGTAAAAATITAASLTDQSAATSAAVGTDPSVRVADIYDNPVSGVAITWDVASGGGSVDTTGGTSTGADGLATVTSWTLGASVGANSLTATAAGLTGSPVTFTASATSALPTQLVVQSGGSQTGIVAGQASATITFRVKDAGNNALEGVTVGFTADGGILSASSDVSDASGDVQVILTTSALISTYTVTASYTNGSGTLVSADTTVASTFGAATRLNIVTEPSASGSSGTALTQQPHVEITDANGNRVTSGASSSLTITATLATGDGSVSAGSTAVASAGLATFSGLTITDSDGGSSSLLMSSGALTTDTSQTISLTPPTPAQVAPVVQPSTVAAGVVISPAPTFTIRDASGNLVPGATDSVTLTLGDNGEGATLGGTTTVAAVGGTATFSNLTVSAAGSYTLNPTSGTLTPTNSAAFTVNANSGGANTPNKPGTITTIRERFWNAQNDANAPGNLNVEGGWYDSVTHTWPQVVATTDATLIADLTAGQVAALYSGTAGNVGKTQFAAGASANGTSPAQTRFTNGASAGFNSEEVYVSLKFAVSLNWYQLTDFKLIQFATHTPGTNANNRTSIVSHLRSSPQFGNDTSVVKVNLTITNINGNIISPALTVTRGSVNHLEMYLKMNTNGASDGILKTWMNGVAAWNISDQVFRGSSHLVLGGDEFYGVYLYHSIGGPSTASTLPASQRLYYGYTAVGWA